VPESIKVTESTPPVLPAVDAPARVDETGVELKRGTFLNTIAMVAANFMAYLLFWLRPNLANPINDTFGSVRHRLVSFRQKFGQNRKVSHGI
jgi:hypothetical protein